MQRFVEKCALYNKFPIIEIIFLDAILKVRVYVTPL